MAFINITLKLDEERFKRIEHKLDKLVQSEEVEDYLIEEIETLKKQLRDVLSGEVLPPAVQTKIDEIFNKLSLDTTKVKKIIEENKTKSL